VFFPEEALLSNILGQDFQNRSGKMSIDLIAYQHYENRLEEMIRKILIKKIQIAFSAIPSANTSRQTRGGGRRDEKAKRSFQHFFRKFPEKVLTEPNANVLLNIFPLRRERFFEIYFVRLIGTPNQHIPS